MNKSVRVFAILVLLSLASVVNAAENTYHDHFSLGPYEIFVKFYEPIDLIKLKFPNFDFKSREISDDNKLKIWIDCLHISTIYQFTAKDKQGNIKKHFCMRGNPNIRNSARFYVVDIISGKAPVTFDPNRDSTSQWVERTVSSFSVGDVLFEHMSLFQDPSNKQYVGNGVKFFGKYFRVTPYEEVQKAMTLIMKDELGV